jgi:hypothetical protein
MQVALCDNQAYHRKFFVVRLIVSILALAVPSYAVAFDCAEPKTNSEKTICLNSSSKTLVITGSERIKIGSPLPKSSTENYSNIDDPDMLAKSNNYVDKYTVSCAPLETGLGKTYSAPDKRKANKGNAPRGASWSMAVIYFVTIDEEQYIYGNLVDGKGFSNGIPIYVLSKDWSCQLFNNNEQPHIDGVSK